MCESVPSDSEVLREIMIQGMTNEEYRNFQGSIEDVFDEQEDCACGCCGPSLVNKGVEEEIKLRDAWQVMYDLHKIQDCGASKYEPSFVLARDTKKRLTNIRVVKQKAHE